MSSLPRTVACTNDVGTLREARLYGIIDRAYVSGEDAAGVLEKMVAGGIDVVQLRAKNCGVDEVRALAEKLLPVARATGIPLLVNDHVEIAQAVEVAGAHLGQDDETIAIARAVVSRPILIGKSTHSLAQAMAAEEEGADYIGFGPLFATPTKPDYAPIGLENIRAVHERVSLPIFCIGGIHINNLQRVIDAGAKRVVMVSAILKAHSIRDYVRCATDMLA